MSEALGSCFDHAGRCITCGDLGVEMRVLRVDEGRSLALCEDAHGVRATVEIGLVDATPGAGVLVHAGTAIARLEVPA
jgi:hydrogenase expression/formation protein HypC